MPDVKVASNTTAPTQFLEVKAGKYAYRRFGKGPGLPLLCLQHFTGTLDNWDPAVTDSLAARHEIILFESAGLGRSSGKVPETVAGMAAHAFAFLDGLGLESCDVLGFSLGGMVAQQMVLDRPSVFRRMILVGTAPRGGEDIMHLEKPVLSQYLKDPNLHGYAVLQKTFFAPTASSQAAGEAFIGRLLQRKEDREPNSGPDVAQAQIKAFREWERVTGELIRQPTLVVNGVHDEMIPVRKFVLAQRESSQRRASDLSRLRTWFPVPISRVLYAPVLGVSRVRFRVCAILMNFRLNFLGRVPQ